MEKYKNAHDKARKDVTFEPGQLVYLKRPFKSGGLERLYDGPFKVVERKSDLNYRLENLDGTKLKIHDVFHIARLKPYHGEIEKEEEEEDVESEEEQEKEDDNKEDDDWEEILSYNAKMNDEQVQDEVEQEIPAIGVDGDNQQHEAPQWISPRVASVPQMRRILQDQGMPISTRATRDDVRLTYENAYRGVQQVRLGVLVHTVRVVNYRSIFLALLAMHEWPGDEFDVLRLIFGNFSPHSILQSFVEIFAQNLSVSKRPVRRLDHLSWYFLGLVS